MPPTPPPYLFTSQQEIERLWSSMGAELLADDDQDGNAEDGVWDDIIYEATETVSMYCQKRYLGAALASSPWVHRAATVLGAYFLSSRRGLPERYEDRYQRVMSLLEEVLNGRLRIPNLALSSQQTPALSTYVVDDRFSQKNIRTVPGNSVGTRTADQHTDIFLPLDPMGF